jgi:hypothetical protein
VWIALKVHDVRLSRRTVDVRAVDVHVAAQRHVPIHMMVSAAASQGVDSYEYETAGNGGNDDTAGERFLGE